MRLTFGNVHKKICVHTAVLSMKTLANFSEMEYNRYKSITR